MKRCIDSYSALSLLSSKVASGAFLASCHKRKQNKNTIQPSCLQHCLRRCGGNCHCASWQGCKCSQGCPEPWRWGGGGMGHGALIEEPGCCLGGAQLSPADLPGAPGLSCPLHLSPVSCSGCRPGPQQGRSCLSPTSQQRQCGAADGQAGMLWLSSAVQQGVPQWGGPTPHVPCQHL